MYEYKVVSGNISVNHSKKETVEGVVEKMLNTMQSEGWEFYSQGTTSEIVSPGCLGMLFGKKETIIYHQTFIFRKKKESK